MSMNFISYSGDFCGLLIKFVSSLDSDQARQNVRMIWIQTDKTDGILDRFFPKNLILKKIADDKRHAKLPAPDTYC